MEVWRIWKNVLECSGTQWKLMETNGIWQNLMEHYGRSWNMTESGRIFWNKQGKNILEYLRIWQNVIEYGWTTQNDLEITQIGRIEPCRIQ